ncbi:MAG: SprB repeat-containing protein [Janthinobacterium lividum]
MAGERYAKATIRAAWSWNAFTRGKQTEEVRFKLAGQWEVFQRGGNSNQFSVPDPDPSATDPRDFVLRGVNNLLALIRARIAQKGLPYTVSTARDVGDDSSHLGGGYANNPEVNPWPIVEFDVTATVYANSLDLDFADYSPAPQQGLGGWSVVGYATTIRPVFVSAQVTDAIIYGSATGAITLVAINGDTGIYSYVWSDPNAPTTATRTKLVGPASYTCLVSDASGASTSITVPVGSDPRLDVLVQKIARDVTLITTGGVAPYTYLWTDGNTSDVRLNLAPGSYRCTVTDSHGATVTVSFEIEAFNRFYFSRNPVVVELAASNLATKPNLRFICEVWLEQDYLSGVFVNIAGELTQPADAAGRTTFDVSTLLDAYVQPDFPLHGQAGVQLAGQCFKRFYVQHSEYWDGSPAPTFTVRETLYLVYGGLDFYEHASQTYFSTYRPQVHPFLTWEPEQKEVFADQPEYLYYQHDSLTEATFSVQVTCLDSAGGRTTQVLHAATGVQCFEVWRLGVGLAQMRATLPVAPPLDTVAWEVSVQVPGGYVSETRYYQLSEELPANRRYFLYANSVAGINTLACRGKAKTELTFTNVLVQRSLLPGYKADAGETYTTNIAGVPTVTANTGYLTPEQMQAFQDFLLSEEIRYYDADRYRPGSLLPADTLLVQDDDTGLLSVDFSHVQPTLRRYTPTLPR